MEGREKYLQLLMENHNLKKKKIADIHTPTEQKLFFYINSLK